MAGGGGGGGGTVFLAILHHIMVFHCFSMFFGGFKWFWEVLEGFIEGFGRGWDGWGGVGSGVEGWGGVVVIVIHRFSVFFIVFLIDLNSFRWS